MRDVLVFLSGYAAHVVVVRMRRTLWYDRLTTKIGHAIDCLFE